MICELQTLACIRGIAVRSKILLRWNSRLNLWYAGYY